MITVINDMKSNAFPHSMFVLNLKRMGAAKMFYQKGKSLPKLKTSPSLI